MQLSVRKALEQGKVSNSRAECIQALDDSSFNEEIAQLIAENLSQNEQLYTEKFFSTPTGEKYGKFGLMQIYIAVGENPPEALPTFTEDENNAIESFKHTGAGKKLTEDKILENSSARQVIMSRIQELLKNCS